MTMIPEWQAMEQGGLIYGIYRLPGAANWRYLREKGEKRTFPTQEAAASAAREKVLSILFPPMRGTIAPEDAKVAESLGVEQWLRTRRQDAKAAQTIYKPGKRPLYVVKGKVVA